jgi:chromosome segregation ATPase
MNKPQTPSNEVARPYGCKCDSMSVKVLGDGCEECNKALVIEMLTDERDELQAEVEEIRAALGDDGRRTHKEIIDLANKASQWREWKTKYIELKNAHMAEGQDPAGTIWEHADKLQRELKATNTEVARLQQQIKNMEEIIDDDTKQKTELHNEVARLREENADLKEEVAKLKQGKVFVDPKWVYNLETQLAKAHEELCQAGLREYGN